MELTSCARRMVTPDVWRMLTWVERAREKVCLPATGGGLDQTQSFLDSWDFFSAEMRYWDAKLGIKK
jgi:hypothetical protein